MMYGWNFTGENIPPHVKARFAETKQIAGIGRVRLQGVTDSLEELSMMKLNADNGHRLITTVGPRRIKGVDWTAIYTS
jgi:hypothetical protein